MVVVLQASLNLTPSTHITTVTITTTATGPPPSPAAHCLPLLRLRLLQLRLLLLLHVLRPRLRLLLLLLLLLLRLRLGLLLLVLPPLPAVRTTCCTCATSMTAAAPVLKPKKQFVEFLKLVHMSSPSRTPESPYSLRTSLGSSTLRVQVLNNHILTQNLYYSYYYPKPKYLILGYLDPKPYISQHLPIHPCRPLYIHLKGPNSWVFGPSGPRP